MNPESEENLQQRLQRLEAEINAKSSETGTRQGWQSNLLKVQLYSTRWQLWFKNLPGVSKLVVVGATVLLGLAVLQAVLKLVSSAITLAVLAGLVYLGYKFFVSGSFSNKQ